MRKAAKLLSYALCIALMLSCVSLLYGQDVRPLYAGQNYEVGTVTVWNDDDNLFVQYDIIEPGWTMSESHLYVGEAGPKKPSPGRFPYKMEDFGYTRTQLYTIPLSDFKHGSAGDDLVIAAHAVVEEWSIPIGARVPYIVRKGVNSYFTAYFEGMVLPAWCVDLDHFIDWNRKYMPTIYTTLDPNVPGVDKPENLDLVNYLLNTDYSYLSATWKEYQAAIWTIIDFKAPVNIGQKQAIVNQMVGDAFANGEGYTPGPGDKIGILFFIGNVQTTIAFSQTTITGICLGELLLGDETAWAFGDKQFRRGWGWSFVYKIED